MMEQTPAAISAAECVKFSYDSGVYTCTVCGAPSFSSDFRAIHTLAHAFGAYDSDTVFSMHALSRAVRVCNRDLSAPLADRLEAAYAEACRVREAEHVDM